MTHIIHSNNPHIQYEGFIEATITKRKAIFYRFKREYVSQVDPNFYDSSNAAGSAGISITFRTNSPLITAFFEENLTYTQSFFDHEIAIFKNEVFQGTSNDFEIALENSTQKIVEWKLVMPIFSQMDFLRLEAQNIEDLLPLENHQKPVYLAIGDSITHGYGTTGNASHLTYPFLVAEALGFTHYNWGIGGSKVSTKILDNLDNQLNPQLISVLWGFNDVHYAWDDEYLEEYTFKMYEKLFAQLCRKFPTAQVLAILPTYTTAPINTEILTIENLEKGELSIIQNLQKKYTNLSYIKGSDYTNTSSLDDEVHLNDLGHQQLAKGILSELKTRS